MLPLPLDQLTGLVNYHISNTYSMYMQVMLLMDVLVFKTLPLEYGHCTLYTLRGL